MSEVEQVGQESNLSEQGSSSRAQAEKEILKKGKKDDLGNFRPVSLVLVPGKIMIILGVIERHGNHW